VALSAQQPAAGTSAGETRLSGLSVVLPCFNEEANVSQAVGQALAAARLVSSRYEVIVVDDGSSDGTAEVAARLAAVDHDVRLVVHPENRGYGTALRSGIEAARMPWVLLTDADLQFDFRQVEDFLPFTDSYDLIVGNRVTRRDPVSRRANAAAWNWLMRRMFALPVHDVDCAFKLVRRDVLEDVDLVASGAMISTEMIVKALQTGARVKELDVSHRPRVAGEQSGASPRVIWRAFGELVQLRGVLRARTHPTG
jgi:glycosyltransferase involved in cell wall biosynthesis